MTEKKRRRGHNEGSIYQRASDGRWVGSVHLGWDETGRRRKVVYGKTRAEVSRKIAKIIADHQKGLPIQTSDKTLSVFLDEWLEESVKPSVRPRTYDSYRLIVNLHLTPALGKHKLPKLTQQHIMAMMAAKRADGSSERTIAYIRAVLRIALNQAMRLDLVHRNVAALVKPPTVPQYEATALDTTQALRLLEQVRSDRLAALYGVALSLGLRQAEAFGLRWKDVDLDGGLLTVRFQLRVVDGEPTFVEPKSRRSRRTITLPAPLVTALKAHRMRQKEERLKAGPRWQDHDLVFSTPIGSPLDDSNVRKQFAEHLDAAGLPSIRYHDLRHSAASLLAARGVAQRTVMEILGHTQMSTTSNVYTHVTTDSMKEATDRMADLFEPRKATP
ncbi:MAG: site-specific integrase [Chloroflexota bacterium]|nr:site-specific integrase [Chloroflexota bacterium]